MSVDDIGSASARRPTPSAASAIPFAELPERPIPRSGCSRSAPAYLAKSKVVSRFMDLLGDDELAGLDGLPELHLKARPERAAAVFGTGIRGPFSACRCRTREHEARRGRARTYLRAPSHTLLFK